MKSPATARAFLRSTMCVKASSLQLQVLFVFLGVFLSGDLVRPAAAADLTSIGKAHYAGVEGHFALDHHIATLSDKATLLEAPDDASTMPKEIAKWTGHSSVPAFIQFLLATSWIGLMGMLPVILPIIEREPITKTQIAMGCSMMVVVFGGFFLFTNIILFQSPHFDRIRPLTVVECIYLMAQIITTVGYGDVTPAKPRGQLVVALYVLGALFVIANLISDLIEHLVKHAQDVKEAAAAKISPRKGRPEGGEQDLPVESPRFRRRRRSEQSLNSLLKPQSPDLLPIAESVLVLVFCMVGWICFFTLYPGENKTLSEATYMSLITFSTVGFGALTPVTEGGMIFAAFWMLFGSATLVNVITQFTELMVQMKTNEREVIKDADECSHSLSMMEGGGMEGSEDISEAQFLRFGLLKRKLASEADIDQILEAFKALPSVDGKVNKDVVKDSLHMARSGTDYTQESLNTWRSSSKSTA